jgi:hypothetical protein
MMFISFVAQLLQGIAVTFLAVTLPLSPFVCAVLAGDARYLWRYFETLRRCAGMIRQMVRADVIARRILIELSPKVTLPDQHVVGECTHCGKCCIHKSCVYLEFDAENKSRCAIYNNWFWKKTSCGEYPVNANEIEVYDCPSFRAVPIKVIALRRNGKGVTVVADGSHTVIPMKRPRSRQQTLGGQAQQNSIVIDDRHSRKKPRT